MLCENLVLYGVLAQTQQVKHDGIFTYSRYVVWKWPLLTLIVLLSNFDCKCSSETVKQANTYSHLLRCVCACGRSG